MTTSDNISAIEAVEKALEKATPGEWIAYELPGGASTVPVPVAFISGPTRVIRDRSEGFSPADAAYIAACNPVAMSAILAEARKAHEELAVARSVHRWNVDRYGENLAVCRNEHEKGDPCEWETFVPLSRAEAVERKAEAMGLDRKREAQLATDMASDCLDEQKRREAAEARVAALENALQFVSLWAWREDPPNANSKLTDAERLSVIKHHPTVKSFYETGARTLLSKESADADR